MSDLVCQIQKMISDYQVGMGQSFPRFLQIIIDGDLWQKGGAGERDFKTFEEFVRCNPPHGLFSTKEQVLAHCIGDWEITAKLHHLFDMERAVIAPLRIVSPEPIKQPTQFSIDFDPLIPTRAPRRPPSGASKDFKNQTAKSIEPSINITKMSQ